MTANERHLAFAHGLICNANHTIEHAIGMMFDVHTNKAIPGTEEVLSSLHEVADGLEKVKDKMWHILYPMTDFGPEKKRGELK